MKKHLDSLFVTTQDAYLAKDGEPVAVNVEQEVRLRIPNPHHWRDRQGQPQGIAPTG